MSDNVVELSDSNFKETIESGVTLVDFWAPWCGPCMMQGPIVDEVAKKVSGKARVAKVNVDESMETAVKYRIQSIPTLLVFREGEVENQLIGLHSEEQLISAIEKAL